MRLCGDPLPRDMQYTTTLKKNHEFRRLYAKGRSAVTPTLVVYSRRNNSGANRVGFTVTVKLGHAVVRNRIRRRLREIYRLREAELRRGHDLVIVARGRSVKAAYRELERDFLTACGKLSLLADTEPHPAAEDKT